MKMNKVMSFVPFTENGSIQFQVHDSLHSNLSKYHITFPNSLLHSNSYIGRIFILRLEVANEAWNLEAQAFFLKLSGRNSLDRCPKKAFLQAKERESVKAKEVKKNAWVIEMENEIYCFHEIEIWFAFYSVLVSNTWEDEKGIVFLP